MGKGGRQTRFVKGGERASNTAPSLAGGRHTTGLHLPLIGCSCIDTTHFEYTAPLSAFIGRVWPIRCHSRPVINLDVFSCHFSHSLLILSHLDIYSSSSLLRLDSFQYLQVPLVVTTLTMTAYSNRGVHDRSNIAMMGNSRTTDGVKLGWPGFCGHCPAAGRILHFSFLFRFYLLSVTVKLINKRKERKKEKKKEKKKKLIEEGLDLNSYSAQRCIQTCTLQPLSSVCARFPSLNLSSAYRPVGARRAAASPCFHTPWTALVIGRLFVSSLLRINIPGNMFLTAAARPPSSSVCDQTGGKVC